MKRVMIAVLALVLLLALSGCGRKEDPYADIQDPVATITMSDGSQMRFQLDPRTAPNTVANFIKLANDGFYDGKQVFRVVSNVLIQSGDPNNDGTGGPSYAIKGEFSANGVQNSVSHLRGAISMARQSGYDTAGGQFFIMQGSYPEYDGQYAAFGSIIDEASFAVLDSIAAQPTDSTYLPLTRQVISTIRVETYGVEYPDPEILERE